MAKQSKPYWKYVVYHQDKPDHCFVGKDCFTPREARYVGQILSQCFPTAFICKVTINPKRIQKTA